MTIEENLFLAKKLLVENIYNTAKLEGVNATFPEVEAILDGVNVAGVKLDDIQVILNLRDAWRDVLTSILDTPIDIHFIKKINGSVSRNESLEWGTLRTGIVGISGTNHKPKIPNPQEVDHDISAIVQATATTTTEQAIDIMMYIMYNQLFWDGNKRTATITANALLIKGGAGVLSITPNNITEFNRLLKQYYDTGNGRELKEFLYTTAIVNFDTRDVPVNVPVNSTEQAVLEEIKKDPSLTYDDIALSIGKNRKTVARAVAALKEKGEIRREGSDKSGWWIIS